MSRRFTVSGRLRMMVLTVVALMVLIAGASIISLVTTRANFQRLSTQIVPAYDANRVVLQTMTSAETGLRGYAATHNATMLAPYRGAEQDARTALDTIEQHVPADQVVSPLVEDQRRAVNGWWRYADATVRTLDRGGQGNLLRGERLFAQVRASNAALQQRLLADRDHARAVAYSTLLRDGALVVVVTALALLICLYGGYRVSRSLTVPLTRLREVVSRQHDGDLSARADDQQGALEVRSLATDFNALSRQNEELQRSQRQALAMHQLTLDVEQAVRRAHGVQPGLDVLCQMLGEGMGADRVMANTVDADQAVVLGAQWGGAGLAPLGDIPADLVPHVGRLAGELWESASSLQIRDFLAPEVQAQERGRIFHRETGARAGILVPIGLGERVIGMIFVLMVHEPRRWTAPEANVVQQCAAFVAQMISETEHQQHLAEHVSRLEQLDRQKTDFLSTVSHELRTPLTSISGYLELLQDGEAGELARHQHQMLGVIDRNTTRLRGLIDDLLVLNRIESGRLGSQSHRMSLCELVTQTVEEMRPVAQAAGVRLEAEAGRDSAMVLGDRTHMQRAIANVLSNAVKFTPRDGAVTVGCRVDVGGGRAVLTCRDTGIGIPEADLDQLFTRFYRASNATSLAIPGTGLGLAIVQQIVQEHHGELRLTSREGQGTTVEIDLPLAPAGGEALRT